MRFWTYEHLDFSLRKSIRNTEWYLENCPLSDISIYFWNCLRRYNPKIGKMHGVPFKKVRLGVNFIRNMNTQEGVSKYVSWLVFQIFMKIIPPEVIKGSSFSLKYPVYKFRCASPRRYFCSSKTDGLILIFLCSYGVTWMVASYSCNW